MIEEQAIELSHSSDMIHHLSHSRKEESLSSLHSMNDNISYFQAVVDLSK